MNNSSEILHTLVIKAAPRNIFLRPVTIFTLCDTIPSNIKPLKNQEDPSLLHVYSPKHNYSLFNQKLIYNYLHKSYFNSYNSLYGLSSNLSRQTHSNYWLYTQCNSRWYWNQHEAIKFSRIAKYIPGIKEIRLVGSSSLEAGDDFSDIDLVVETNKRMVWVVRLWLKLILKTANKDVYMLRFQIYKILATIGLIRSNSVINNKISAYKKNRRIKVDVGLITSDWNAFKKRYLPLRPDTIFFNFSKVLWSAKGDNMDLVAHQVENRIQKVAANIGKSLLLIVSCLLYPLIIVWSWLYIMIHKQNKYYIITQSHICFYPIIPRLYKTFEIYDK